MLIVYLQFHDRTEYSVGLAAVSVWRFATDVRLGDRALIVSHAIGEKNRFTLLYMITVCQRNPSSS